MPGIIAGHAKSEGTHAEPERADARHEVYTRLERVYVGCNVTHAGLQEGLC